MRTRRILVRGGKATYHCMSRTVDGAHLFERREKEALRKMLWQVADFSGVRVLTYCLMSNHFHVLVEVPEVGLVSDVELLRRYRALYPKPSKYAQASIRVLERILAAGGDPAEALRARLLNRMGNVSEFMKTLKLRFSIWFNKAHRRFGPLWSDRFKSVLVEGRGDPLQTMAAYIDLNPVRAGLVSDPKDYRWSGYGEAVGGRRLALAGLRRVWLDRLGGDESPSSILSAHRSLLFGVGSESRLARGGQVIDAELARRVIEQDGGVLPRAAALRCQIRYFSDGLVLGSVEFVRGFAESVRAVRKRKKVMGPIPMEGADWGDVAVLQKLDKENLF